MTDTSGTTVTDIGPLDWRIGIVDNEGRPTPEFQRRWNSQRSNNGLIPTISVGTGAPTSTPTSDGNEYINISTTPPTLYVSSGGSWIKVGVYNFIQLADVPSSYTSKGSYVVRVNAAATGLEFDTVSSVLDTLGTAQGSIAYRSSTGWTVLAPSTAGYVLSTNGPTANPTWVAQTGGGSGSGSPSAPLVNGVTPGPTFFSDGNGRSITVVLTPYTTGAQIPDTRIITYLDSGTYANLPSAPAIPAGGCAFYYTTDTSHLYVYGSGGWSRIV